MKDAAGAGLPGANIVAVHVPSGTTYGSASRSDGRFTLPGLRSGGPYKVSISICGVSGICAGKFKSFSRSEFCAKSYPLWNLVQNCREIVVSTNPLLNDERTGAGTNINIGTISAMPTISRDLSDFTRLTPQANGRSFSGADSRFNNLTIDGSIFNNSFGLSDVPWRPNQLYTHISLMLFKKFRLTLPRSMFVQGGFHRSGCKCRNPQWYQ
ncbi:MAG: carboxypeptidase-like regulatory domain-containing protein [Cytophagales bacterium]|nr:carboxypeptidase-like regulatory domain-containing protein [Cytophagales bacterium]